MCLFLSMVVWQPFESCWRLIIARVSEMHVAYHILVNDVVYLHQRNKQHSQSLPCPQLTKTYLNHRKSGSWRASVGARGRTCVRQLEMYPSSLCLCLLLVVLYVCSSVWSFGSHFVIAGVISLRVSPKCTSHIIRTLSLWYIYISGTNKQQPFAIFLLSGSVCDMSLHLHYISSISPCFLYLVNQLGAMMSI